MEIKHLPHGVRGELRNQIFERLGCKAKPCGISIQQIPMDSHLLLEGCPVFKYTYRHSLFMLKLTQKYSSGFPWNGCIKAMNYVIKVLRCIFLTVTKIYKDEVMVCFSWGVGHSIWITLGPPYPCVPCPWIQPSIHQKYLGEKIP